MNSKDAIQELKDRYIREEKYKSYDCDTCHGLGRVTLFAGLEKVECTCMVCNVRQLYGKLR